MFRTRSNDFAAKVDYYCFYDYFQEKLKQVKGFYDCCKTSKSSMSIKIVLEQFEFLRQNWIECFIFLQFSVNQASLNIFGANQIILQQMQIVIEFFRTN